MGGDGGVGKTTLLHRYVHNEFLQDMKLTIGVQIHTQTFERQGKGVNLALWDLGGQERFRFVQDSFMRGASAAFVCFDMSRYATINRVREWVDMIRQNAGPSIPIMLVGTKMDLVSDGSVLESMHRDAKELVKELDLCCYSPTSSKWNFNVHESIQYMVDTLILHAHKAESLQPAGQSGSS